MASWFAQLGPVGIPLALCSLVALGLILERAVFFARAGRPCAAAGARLREAFGAREINWAQLPPCVEVEGARLIWRYRDAERDLRADALALFLDARREEQYAHLGLLRLIAALAPMLGLLGTVIGMLVAFQAIATHTGPVHPALLAGGLSQAMWTTILGLLIAAPAMIAAQLFRMVARKRVAALGRLFDELILQIEDRRGLRPAEMEPPIRTERRALA